MWSTYILPNGHFLNPENSKSIKEDPDYEHSDFEYWLSANGIGREGFKALDEHCIKMNVTYPYLFLPVNRVTSDQVKAIRKIIDSGDFDYDHDAIQDWLYDDSNDNNNPYEMENPLLVIVNTSTKVFDLAIYSSRDIIKDITRAYSLGHFLNESEWRKKQKEIVKRRS
jgi:hypothetical protein